MNLTVNDPLSTEAAPKLAGVVEIAKCRYGPMLAFAEDTVITRSLQTYGEWSEHEISILSHYIRDDTLVLDVGANIGTHALAFAKRKPRATIWGFEPQPLVHSLAWTNCARNGAQNVAILQMACSDAPGDIVLGPPLVSNENVGAFSLVGRVKPHAFGGSKPGSRASGLVGGLGRSWTRLLRASGLGGRVDTPPAPTPPFMHVPVLPLDSLCFPLPVSLLKVDVEGMETAVLAGARELLARDRPAVFFETLSTDGLAGIADMLRGLGYRLFWMETHQFNRANFRKCEENLWWRTEMGVLGVGEAGQAQTGWPELDRVPAKISRHENARAGTDVIGNHYTDERAGSACLDSALGKLGDGVPPPS